MKYTKLPEAKLVELCSYARSSIRNKELTAREAINKVEGIAIANGHTANKFRVLVQMKVFKKHKINNLYWSFEFKTYVSHNEIPVGSLVIDHLGRDISGLLKV